VNGEDKFDGKKYGETLGEQIRQDVHDRMQEKLNRRPNRHGLLPGLVLVLIGTVVLLDHMGLLSTDRLWKFWPVLLIAVGAFKFFREYSRVFGAILMLIGGVLLLNNLGYTRLSWWDIWPIALIAAGVALMWSRFELPRIPRMASGAPNSGLNSINEYAMFGGVERRISVNNFAGGTATATFGGIELDFRSADIEGEEAVLYIEAIFGGIEVTVPERWTVIYEGQSIFGGYSDETRPPLPDLPGAPPRKRLILRGRAVFGGISVKN
jgi:predicted membrane protein